MQMIHAKSANVSKGDEFYGLLDSGPGGGKSVQMVQDNEAHAARRRILDKAMPARDRIFHDIDGLAQKFASVVGEEARSRPDGTVDITPITSWYSFDVISTVAFGAPLDMMHSQTWRWIPLCLQEASIFLYAAGYAPFLRLWRWLLASKWPARPGLTTVVAAQRYADLAAERVSDRVARLGLDSKHFHAEAANDDLFGNLVRGGSHSVADLCSESSLLIAAGSGAVRLTIAATLFYWLRNPQVMNRAVAEIKSLKLDSDGGMTEPLLASLRYLRAYVDETMRLTPPKPGRIPQQVQAGGIIIDGVPVLKGMTVGVSTRTLHRDPDIFQGPDDYQPERWLERPQDPRMLAAFCPFLKGPRACPGESVAYSAIQLALFHLIREHELREGGGENDGSD